MTFALDRLDQITGRRSTGSWVSLQGLKRLLALNSQNSRKFSSVEWQWCGWKESSGEELSVYTTTKKFKDQSF